MEDEVAALVRSLFYRPESHLLIAHRIQVIDNGSGMCKAGCNCSTDFCAFLRLIVFLQLPEMTLLVPFSRGLWGFSTPSEASKAFVSDLSSVARVIRV
jgi:hypothetical protein